jgi:hypothetical protein
MSSLLGVTICLRKDITEKPKRNKRNKTKLENPFSNGSAKNLVKYSTERSAGSTKQALVSDEDSLSSEQK